MGERVDAAFAGQRRGSRKTADRVIDQHRADIDDRPAGSLLLHPPNRRLRGEIRTAQIAGEKAVQLRLGHL